MKNGIRLLGILIGFQCIALQSGIVIENITVIDAKNEVRNEQTVFIENGLILGLIILAMAFRMLNHIWVFVFVTLLHYSFFFISPFILSMGIIINKEINNKTK